MLRRERPATLLVEAHDTARAEDWTSVRDVMQVRRQTRISQRELFLQCLGAVVILVLAALAVLAAALAIHYVRAYLSSSQ